MIVQRLVLKGGYPDGLYTCAGCEAELRDNVFEHEDDCPEFRAGYWHKRWLAACERADQDGTQAISQHVRIQNLKRQVREMQVAAERRNRELDALHLVWCDGGCSGGVHRWSDTPVTRELVEAAERNTRRLRRWYRIAEFRMRLPGADEWSRRRQQRIAAKTDLKMPTEGSA